MKKSEQFQNLRGGTVYAAATVHPGTARAWVANNGLRVGTRNDPQGHPRYDLADATRLLLMQFLTARHGMQAQAAADIVNGVHGHIGMSAGAYLDQLDDPNFKSTWKRNLVAFMTTSQRPEVRTLAEHIRDVQSRAIVSETVIDLRAAVSLAAANFANAPLVEELHALLEAEAR